MHFVCVASQPKQKQKKLNPNKQQNKTQKAFFVV